MSHPHAQPEAHAPGEAPLDVRERGAQRDGQPQLLDRRLFMQLLVLDCRPEPGAAASVQKLAGHLRAASVGSVIYEDVNDPFGIGLLTFTEEPADFVTKVRPAVAALGAAAALRPEFTMLGRSYSSGFEQDLEFWLLKRPRETVLNEAWPWAIWYPLRRTGAFARLEPRDQGGILREHGTIGKTYAAADLAHDVRLACHGLDAKDNEFVIGLIGKELHPLSHVVQSMRTTRQTAEFIAQMGPFFVGRAVVRTPG